MMRKDTCARWSYRTMKVSMHGWSCLSTQRREVSGVMSETFISQCHQCTAHRWWWQFFQFRRAYSPTMTWLYSPTTHLTYPHTQCTNHKNIQTCVYTHVRTRTPLLVTWLSCDLPLETCSISSAPRACQCCHGTRAGQRDDSVGHTGQKIVKSLCVWCLCANT